MIRRLGSSWANLSILVLLGCGSSSGTAGSRGDGGPSGSSSGSGASASSGVAASSGSGSTGGSGTGSGGGSTSGSPGGSGAGASTSAASSGSSAGAGSGTSSGGPSGGPDASGAEPSLAITSPTAGASVTNTMGNVPISFLTTNFALVAPGDPSCPDGSNDCGHVHLFVDGAACTPPGQPYNNDGQASPIEARLTACAAVAGSHTAMLELHHNDHSPVVVGGASVSASVTFTAM